MADLAFPWLQSTLFLMDDGTIRRHLHKSRRVLYQGVPKIVDVVEPTGTCLGSILMVHGMSAAGPKDPRLLRFAHRFVRRGYRVVLPTIPSFQKHRIDASSISEIRSWVEAVLLRPDWHSQPLAIVSASFSATLCQLAVCQHSTASLVDHVIAVGGFGKVETVLKFLLTDPKADPYGRLIVLKNFYRDLGDFTDEFEHVMDRAIAANWKNQPFDLEGPIGQINCPNTRAFASALIHDPSVRIHAFDLIRARRASLFKALDLIENMTSWMPPITLVHGAQDAVIPATESQLVANRAAELGVDHQVVITPLLGHANIEWRWSYVRDILRLKRAFGHFLDRAQWPIPQELVVSV